MHLFVGTRSWAWSTVMLDAEMYDIFGMQILMSMFVRNIYLATWCVNSGIVPTTWQAIADNINDCNMSQESGVRSRLFDHNVVHE